MTPVRKLDVKASIRPSAGSIDYNDYIRVQMCPFMHGASAPHGDDAHTTSSNKEVMAGKALEHCFLHVTSYLTRFIQKKPRPKRLCQNTLRKVLCNIGASDCKI